MKLLMIVPIFFVFFACPACSPSFPVIAQNKSNWRQVTAAADFPTGYNFPVFILKGEMVAIRGVSWKSADGRSWSQTALPNSGLNSAFQKYVYFNDAVYALGTMSGNIESMELSSRIQRTRDGESWELLAEKSNLPPRVFYGATAFRGKIWIFGGMMNGRKYDDVWNSADGVKWAKVGEKMPWGARESLTAIVFRDRLYLIGSEEVWSSADGLSWQNETMKMAAHPVFISGYSAVVYDDQIWLVGINRNDQFKSGVLRSSDGRSWTEADAPWTPRGAVAAWVFGNRLFMTGGKYSYVDGRETKFVYSNDVWEIATGNRGERRKEQGF